MTIDYPYQLAFVQHQLVNKDINKQRINKNKQRINENKQRNKFKKNKE